MGPDGFLRGCQRGCAGELVPIIDVPNAGAGMEPLQVEIVCPNNEQHTAAECICTLEVDGVDMKARRILIDTPQMISTVVVVERL